MRMPRLAASFRHLVTLLQPVALLGAFAIVGAGCPDDGPSLAPPPAGCPECVEGSLKVTDDRARSCEAVVAAPAGNAPVVVTFANDVTGRALTEGDRTGIAFVAAAGQGLPQAVATLSAAGEMSLLSSRCFDDTGAPIDGTPLSL